AAYGGEEGNILVNAPVSWSSANGLSLYAHNDIQVAQPVANAGTGQVFMMAGWNGFVGGAFPVFGTGNISISAPVSSNGSIFLFAGNTISQTSSGMLTTPALAAETLAGSVQLNAAFNAVGMLAGKARGQFAFKNSSTDNLNVGAVLGRTGILVSDGGIDAPHVNISVSQNGAGALVIKEPVRALSESRSGNATVTLTSLNGIEVNPLGSVNGRVEASAGSGVVDGGIAYPGGNATVTLTNNGVAPLWVTGELKATAGNGADSSIPGAGGGGGGTATVNVTSSGDLNIHAPVIALAGRGGDGDLFTSGSGGSGGNATLTTASLGNTFINGSITVTGGRGGASVTSAGHGGSASLTMATSGSGAMTISESDMVVIAGDGGTGHVGGLDGSGGGALLQLFPNGDLNVSESSLEVATGNAGAGGFSGAAGDGVIRLNAGGSVTLYQSLVSLDGGETAAGPSPETLIQLESHGDLLIRETLINAVGSFYVGGLSSGDGGNARIEVSAFNGNITVDGAEGSHSTLFALGGNAEPTSSAKGGIGRINIMARDSVNLSQYSLVEVAGGSGGRYSSVGGGSAHVTVQSELGNLDFLNTFIVARGGDGDHYYPDSGIGGGASVLLSAAGPVFLNGVDSFSVGGLGHTRGNAQVQVQSGTRIEINLSYLRAFSDLEAAGDSVVYLAASGPVILNASSLSAPYGGAINIAGSSIDMVYTTVYGDRAVTLSSGSGITAVNYSDVSSGSYYPNSGLSVTALGDLSMDSNSRFYGFPDTNLSIGGNVYLSNNSKIEAGSPDTIFLVFTSGASSNFFVNGAPGVVSDGGTGFFAGGDPAQLGINMFVTNGTPVTPDSKVPAP
ncbi:MAG: hypothetical protein IOC78_05700, partial [Rhodobacter sp.]|nr:hypothetical protein [Rhodobacter sp.]